jgi:hypothetical protein
MWLIAEYKPVSLFSLKSGLATSTGAKTLFVPTPFAIRTALLDAAIRTQGIAASGPVFDALKLIKLAIHPPDRVTVTNLFAKVQKPARKDKKGKSDDKGAEDLEVEQGKAMARTIAFREYAHLYGNLGIAINGDDSTLKTISMLLPQINYFGKRGSFFQILDMPSVIENLPHGYYPLNYGLKDEMDRNKWPQSFPLGVIQIMDDWGPSLDFEKVNIYTEADIKLGKDRVRNSIILPYRLIQSSKSFSLYERGDG